MRRAALRQLDPLHLFVGATVGVGAAVIVGIVIDAATGSLRHPWWDAVFVLALVSAYLVPVSRNGGRSTTGDGLVVAAALVVVGPHDALLVASLGALAALAIRRRLFVRRLFNAAQHALAYVAGIGVLDHWLHGTPSSLHFVLAAVGVTLIAGRVSGALIATALAPSEGKPLRDPAMRAVRRFSLFADAGVGVGGICGGLLLRGPHIEVALVVLFGAALFGFARHVSKSADEHVRTSTLFGVASAIDSLGDADVATFVSEAAGELLRRPAQYVETAPDGDALAVPLSGGGWLVTAARPALDDADRQGLETLAALASAALERKRLLAELAALSLTDPLTGLANRRSINHALGTVLHLASRNGTDVGVLLLDLDGFKALNDTHGHEAGDDALRAVADALRADVRAGDTVGRLGGDEFVVVCPETDADGVAEIAERLARCLDGIARFPDTPVAASIGTALASRDGNDPDLLLAAADAAMYVAKRRRKAARGG